MKFILALLFLAGLALAQNQEKGPNAEGNPEAWYGGYYGYPGYYGYGGYYGRRWGYGYGYYGRKKREADPAVVATTHAAPAVVPHLGYALGAPFLHHAVPHTYTVAHKDAVVTPGKVDVKVAAPAAHVVYAGHYGYAHPYAHWGYGLPLLAKPAEEPAAVEARKKREADSEADPEAWYGHYYGYGGYGYGHRYYGGYYGYPGYGYYGYGK